jgi:hypothetical protein
MRKLQLILLGLIITIDLSAQTSRRVIQLSGSISDKYPINMILTFNGDKVIGFYFYEKFKTNILLEGHIKENNITLHESPNYESDFKIGFIGNLKDDSFSGVWTDKVKNKTLNFRTTIDSDNLTPIVKSTVEIEGTYNNTMSSDKYFSAVDLKHIVDDVYCFEISNGIESGCVGYIKGLIKLIDLKWGLYSGDLCEKLEVTLSSNELTISETNCDLHGMRCPFDGKYKRQ